MIKTLVNHGNSSALIIDKPILELLNINQETPLEISTDGTNLIISPVKNPENSQKLSDKLSRINRKHKTTLKKLAE